MTLKQTSGVKTAFLLMLAAVLIIIVSVLSVAYGSKSMSLATVRDAVFHMDPENIDHVIVQTSRIPRTAGALLIGAFLAVSGALMQGMTRNYLASPSIMGISDGSVFAVTLCMVFLPDASSMTMILYSLAGSALGALLVFGTAKLLPGGVSPLTLAVLGTIIGTFLGGVSQALAVYFQVSQNISFWYNARLHMMDPAIIRLAIPFAVVGLLLALLMARPVTMLSLGDETAAGLGLKVDTIKLLTMLSVVLLTGISVAIAGKIAFIGLIIPHITRFLIGQDYRKIVPFSAFAGAFFLVFCDLISRYIHFPFETPVGVVTALFGVPFFLYLIKTRGAAAIPEDIMKLQPKSKARTFWSLFLLLTALTVVLMYVSLTNGTFDISEADVVRTLLRYHPVADHDLVIFEFRLPRILLGALVGFGLGIAGAVLQGITRNSLADPGILGIHAAAGAFVVVFMFLTGAASKRRAGSR